MANDDTNKVDAADGNIDPTASVNQDASPVKKSEVNKPVAVNKLGYETTATAKAAEGEFAGPVVFKNGKSGDFSVVPVVKYGAPNDSTAISDAQAAVDQELREANPNSAIMREANPLVGGESF